MNAPQSPVRRLPQAPQLRYAGGNPYRAMQGMMPTQRMYSNMPSMDQRIAQNLAQGSRPYAGAFPGQGSLLPNEGQGMNMSNSPRSPMVTGSLQSVTPTQTPRYENALQPSFKNMPSMDQRMAQHMAQGYKPYASAFPGQGSLLPNEGQGANMSNAPNAPATTSSLEAIIPTLSVTQPTSATSGMSPTISALLKGMPSQQQRLTDAQARGSRPLNASTLAGASTNAYSQSSASQLAPSIGAAGTTSKPTLAR